MKETLSYKEAAARLEQIVRYIEQDSPDVDELTKLVEEAVTEADKQLTSLMAQLSEDNEEAHG